MERVHWALVGLVCLMVSVAIGASGCYCWQAAHRNEPTCVVVHQVIDCTVDAAKQLTPVVAGVITTYLQSTETPDWAAVLQRLEGLGLRDAGCILAQLEADFSKPSAGGAAHAAKLRDVRDRFLAWKLVHGLTDVRFKLPSGDTQ